MVGLAFACSACTDASRMFTGRWEATAALDTTWLEGRPELVIGHFGPELTGVVFYRDAFGVVEQPACPCAFVDEDSVDLEGEDFIATTERCGEPVLIWILERLEDDEGNIFLTGSVGPDEDNRADIDLELVDTFVPEDLRACDP